MNVEEVLVSESIIRVRDVAYPRLRAPDLDRMERFLIDFGLTRAAPDRPSFNHGAWEVCDLDDVWLGNAALARAGHRHHWGVGRHTLGGQIFDCWRDPWGHVHEHYTDGDLIDASHRAGVHGPEDAGSPWGPEMPPDFGQPLVGRA